MTEPAPMTEAEVARALRLSAEVIEFSECEPTIPFYGVHLLARLAQHQAAEIERLTEDLDREKRFRQGAEFALKAARIGGKP